MKPFILVDCQARKGASWLCGSVPRVLVLREVLGTGRSPPGSSRPLGTPQHPEVTAKRTPGNLWIPNCGK